MRIYATTTPGLEDVSANEIELLGGKVEEVRFGKGRVFLTGDLELVAKLNYLARTLERVMILLRVEKFEKLDDIYRIVKEIDFSFIKPNQSFAIRPLRVGNHDFTSLDVGRVAGQAVIDSYMESGGVRLKVNLDEPDVIIRVDVINDEVYVGLDTTGDIALHRRGYRVYDHPAPLNPAIASALVMLSGWKCDEILLDPMCGSGTILIESAMMGRNIPPQKLRDDFQFVKIWGKEILEDVKKYVTESDVDLNLVGIERFRKHLKGAKINSEVAGVADTIDYVQGDATKLCLKTADVVVTNPPYGLRIARKGMIEELYEGFLRSAKGIVDRIVVITAEYRILKEKAEALGYVIEEERLVKYGGLDTKVFVLR
ncbi:tRNA (guanine(6)-N2)-methyltransferase [Archaeoglobus profundus]|uniref:RNA methylase n=1 Tax=Archaeoglobus profundus (strain DSM 5631 / JCM 9629 / NBRC 100127 / Av18) TaxID=572546 RepID=D2REG1_ARCPA|nr:tRNA (guanine(6)-N2)-methyltransferase [Archaeoglobus profundus]ADB58505.1 putative RNA methylase [Archaeoglobus profundus DSM 5631]